MSVLVGTNGTTKCHLAVQLKKNACRVSLVSQGQPSVPNCKSDKAQPEEEEGDARPEHDTRGFCTGRPDCELLAPKKSGAFDDGTTLPIPKF